MNPKGIIFTGGPNSVYLEESPSISKEIFELGIPILGICYGHQLTAYMAGGEICSAGSISEYGKVIYKITKQTKLFKGIPEESICWMSHTDYVNEIPEEFINKKSEPNMTISFSSKDVIVGEFESENSKAFFRLSLLLSMLEISSFASFSQSIFILLKEIFFFIFLFQLYLE